MAVRQRPYMRRGAGELPCAFSSCSTGSSSSRAVPAARKPQQEAPGAHTRQQPTQHPATTTKSTRQTASQARISARSARQAPHPPPDCAPSPSPRPCKRGGGGGGAHTLSAAAGARRSVCACTRMWQQGQMPAAAHTAGGERGATNTRAQQLQASVWKADRGWTAAGRAPCVSGTAPCAPGTREVWVSLIGVGGANAPSGVGSRRQPCCAYGGGAQGPSGRDNLRRHVGGAPAAPDGTQGGGAACCPPVQGVRGSRGAATSRPRARLGRGGMRSQCCVLAWRRARAVGHGTLQVRAEVSVSTQAAADSRQELGT